MPQKDTNRAVVSRPADEAEENTTKGINYLFVIAIDAYQHCPRLYNCLRDAKALINVLITQYFFDEKDVTTLFNEEATEGNIFKAFRGLAKKVTVDDNLVIYFSGHGEYDKVFKEGYWIPVNAKLSAQEDFVSNLKIKTILEAINSKHTFLIADSCFSGSLFTQFKSAAVADRLENDPSRWGLTAGRNEVVSDGQVGDHSPFADSLIYHLTNSEVPIGVATLCNRVVENVIAAADQTPRGEPLKVKGHRGGQFFFHPKNVKKPIPPIKEETKHKRGNVLYQIPEQMELEKDTKCIVRIAFEDILLKAGIDSNLKSTVKDIRISNLMEVDLIDPLQAGVFRIRAINEKEQIIDKEDFTQWLFYVKAFQKGTFPLLLKVSLIEVLYGKERRKEIVLEESIKVVTTLKEDSTSAFKNAGYNLSVASKSINTAAAAAAGGGGARIDQLPPPPAPPIIQPPKVEIEPSPTPPKSSTKIYKIIGGIAALLLVLVMSQNVFLGDDNPSPVNLPKPPSSNGSGITTDSDGDKVYLEKVNLRRVTKNGKTGYIDLKTKELIIPHKYEMGSNFKDGVAFVRLNNRWGLINEKGGIVVDFIINQPGKFNDGIAEVFVGTNKVKINTKGETKLRGEKMPLKEFLRKVNR